MTLGQAVGTGSYLPGAPIEIGELTALFGRGVRGLCKAIGVERRHWAREPRNAWAPTGMTTSEMAARAGEAALLDAGADASDVDLLLMVTSTPDFPFPATVTLVQERLGIEECLAIELRAACAGVTQALAIADAFLREGRASLALLIGSEMSSSLIDFNRALARSRVWPDDLLLSAVMFGDGAGALVLEGRAVDEDGRDGLFATLTNSVGRGRSPGFLCRVGGSMRPFATEADAAAGDYLVHDFKAILDMGPRLVLRALDDLVEMTALRFDDFDVVVPPQANPMLIRSTLARQGLDAGRVFWDVDRVGNTSSASLLLALDELNRTGRLNRGDRVALLGAEASKWLYGAAALTWTKDRAPGGEAPAWPPN